MSMTLGMEEVSSLFKFKFRCSDELVLPVPIPLHEWSTVEVKNEATQASVTVNGAVSIQKEHPVPIPFPGNNKPLVIGGQSDEDQRRRPLPGFKGRFNTIPMMEKATKTFPLSALLLLLHCLCAFCRICQFATFKSECFCSSS